MTNILPFLTSSSNSHLAGGKNNSEGKEGMTAFSELLSHLHASEQEGSGSGVTLWSAVDRKKALESLGPFIHIDDPPPIKQMGIDQKGSPIEAVERQLVDSIESVSFSSLRSVSNVSGRATKEGGALTLGTHIHNFRPQQSDDPSSLLNDYGIVKSGNLLEPELLTSILREDGDVSKEMEDLQSDLVNLIGAWDSSSLKAEDVKKAENILADITQLVQQKWSPSGDTFKGDHPEKQMEGISGKLERSSIYRTPALPIKGTPSLVQPAERSDDLQSDVFHKAASWDPALLKVEDLNELENLLAQMVQIVERTAALDDSFREESLSGSGETLIEYSSSRKASDSEVETFLLDAVRSVRSESLEESGGKGDNPVLEANLTKVERFEAFISSLMNLIETWDRSFLKEEEVKEMKNLSAQMVQLVKRVEATDNSSNIENTWGLSNQVNAAEGTLMKQPPPQKVVGAEVEKNTGIQPNSPEELVQYRVIKANKPVTQTNIGVAQKLEVFKSDLIHMIASWDLSSLKTDELSKVEAHLTEMVQFVGDADPAGDFASEKNIQEGLRSDLINLAAVWNESSLDNEDLQKVENLLIKVEKLMGDLSFIDDSSMKSTIQKLWNQVKDLSKTDVNLQSSQDTESSHLTMEQAELSNGEKMKAISSILQELSSLLVNSHAHAPGRVTEGPFKEREMALAASIPVEINPAQKEIGNHSASYTSSHSSDRPAVEGALNKLWNNFQRVIETVSTDERSIGKLGSETKSLIQEFVKIKAAVSQDPKQWSHYLERVFQKGTHQEQQVFQRLVNTYQNKTKVPVTYQQQTPVTGAEVAKWLKDSVRIIDNNQTSFKTEETGQQPVTPMTKVEQWTLQTSLGRENASSSKPWMQELEQMIHSSRFLMNKPGQKELHIQLKPSNLGDMTIKLIQVNGELLVKVLVNTQAAKEMLEGNMSQLRHMFSPNQVMVEKNDSTFNPQSFMQEGSKEEKESSDDQRQNQLYEVTDEENEAEEDGTFHELLMNEKV
ncbi:flagellar hook-length control protein FliK [Halobacillus litoralis]|uniref:flagellar hook-length control protein FliK n=1 Tax=Halobacillus litoralis TaxID=45668 RepID=UPI001CFE43FD|nr:flagellar hook-length control protein FliK [Halobacillus litoralis]